ncbi:hypothetical protein [Tenacibaculum maritimum]|uniref:hypothetical protein n=1 Tax=Tenacibaculum maritimum TaxID=107401 RepID=UPI003875D13C
MFHYNTYKIDYTKLIDWLLPTFKRTAKIKAYLKALLAPIVNLYTDFINFRKDIIYKIKHNGQVVYLQKALNDRFDSVQRRIYITDGIINEPTYIYTHEEDKPVYLGTKYIYTREELKFKDVDFVVILPSSMLLSKEETIRMKSLINYYKLASKTYKIINKNG